MATEKIKKTEIEIESPKLPDPEHELNPDAYRAPGVDAPDEDKDKDDDGK